MRSRTIGTICAVMGAAAVSFADDPALPDGYIPIEWIESTGGQYIDTGVDAGANTTIDMSFGRCVYENGSTLFGKDVWDPHGWLFIMQNGHFRFFGAKGKEPGEAWNLVAKDDTEERDYRFTLGTDGKARMFDANGTELCALATDRSAASHHSLWLFKNASKHGKSGQFRLYSAKIGTDAGEKLRDFTPARRMNDRAVGLYDRVTKSFFANAGTGAFLAPGDPPPRGRRWTLARAREWGRANPWYCGFNHVPANAINDVEIWAKETFSPGNAAGTRKKIAEMSVAGRPIICTEWLFRPSGCDVPNILCIYKETGIGCMLWGLVNGKAQTHLPNGEFTPNFKGPWKHDLFHSDHRPYSVTDLELIKKATGGASAGSAAKK